MTKYDMTWAKINADPMKMKLARAKDYLGSDWVLHQDYQSRVRHSDNDANSPNRVLYDVELRAKVAGRI